MKTPRPTKPTKAERQAAIWSGRLKKLRITNAELREFWAWRRADLENDEAFARLLNRYARD